MARVSFNSSSSKASRPASRVSYRGGQPSKPATPNRLQAKFESSRNNRQNNQRLQAQFEANRGQGQDQQLNRAQQADAARFARQQPAQQQSNAEFLRSLRVPGFLGGAPNNAGVVVPGYPVENPNRVNQAWSQRMQGYADYQVQQAKNRQRGWDAQGDRLTGLGADYYSKPLKPQWTTADYTAPYAYAYDGQAYAESNPYPYTPPAPDYGGGGGGGDGGGWGGGGGGGGGYQQMPEWWMAMTNWRI